MTKPLALQAASVRCALNACGHTGYNDAAKKLFHRRARAFLNRYATEVLGLNDDQFTVRSCVGGIAVVGEVTLHADNFYVQICDPSFSDSKNVLFRSCKGQQDYCGGANHWSNVDELAAWGNGVLQSKTALFLVHNG
jgi:hypothetical protein